MDNTSKIWDVNSERCRYTMCGHKDSVNSVEFLPFSNTVLTSSADKTLSLWDARMGLRVYTFYGHLHSCNHATFNMEGDTIASCDSSGVMKVWDIQKSVPILSVDAGPHPANQVVFDCSGHDERKFKHRFPERAEFDLSAFDIIIQCPSITENTNSPNRRVAWRPGSGTARRPTPGRSGHLLTDTNVVDGKWHLLIGCIVALASSDGSVKVLQLEFGQLSSSLRGHGGEVHSITFDHKAEQLLSGGADGTVCLWT